MYVGIFISSDEQYFQHILNTEKRYTVMKNAKTCILLLLFMSFILNKSVGN